MIMEQLMREKLLTVKKEMEGFMKESVPFWLENGIDKEYGGYLVCFDSKGKLMKELAVLTPEDKMIVTQTRMIWGFRHFFAMAWQNVMAGKKNAKKQQNRV